MTSQEKTALDTICRKKKSNIDNAHYHHTLVCSLNSWASVRDEKQM